MTHPEAQLRALELFDSICDLDAAARDARLAAIEREDAELARAVAELLLADAASHSILDGAPLVMAAMRRPGMQFGSFTLKHLIGRGGMGEVWLAERDEGGFVQRVALKLLRVGVRGDLVRRFLQERRILAELTHPQIARFIDGGVAENGQPWYAMSYVEGVAIDAYVHAQALDLRAVVELIAEVARIVAHAQARLVVHRDLKPSNILVDAGGRPYLLDFGIAKLLDDTAPGSATETGTQAMSPMYAAPEQVLGQAISTATDVFALGLTLYQLLAGELPRREASSLAMLADSVRSERFLPPSRVQHTDTARRQRIDSDLDTVVLMALRAEPERRYRDAAALADDLQRWLDGRPVQAQGDTRTYRIRKFVARNRLAVASAGAVLLALFAGLVLALWQAGVAREQASIARAQTVRAEQEAASGRRITDFALSLVHELNPHGRANAEARTPQQLLSASIDRVRRELADDPEARAVMLGKLGSLTGVTGDLALAEGAIQEALSIAQTHKVRDLAAIQFSMASLRMQQGRNQEAAQLLEQALPDFANDAEGRKYAAMALSHLARIARDGNQLELALTRLQQAEPLFAEAWGLQHGNTIELEGHRGALLFELGHYADAQVAYASAIERFERHHGKEYPRLMAPLAGLARIQALRGEQQPALQSYERALAIGKAKMGPADPYVVRNELAVIQLLCEHGDLDAAEDRLRKTDVSNLQQRPRMLAVLANVRSCLARGSGRFDEELLHLEQARAHALEVNAGDSIELAIALSDLALNALSRKAYCEAEPIAESARSMFSTLANVRLIDRLAEIEVHAIQMARAGRAEEARGLLAGAVEDLESSVGVDSPETKRMRTRLAQISLIPRGTDSCPGS